jgi:hypothetical protein
MFGRIRELWYSFPVSASTKNPPGRRCAPPGPYRPYGPEHASSPRSCASQAAVFTGQKAPDLRLRRRARRPCESED